MNNHDDTEYQYHPNPFRDEDEQLPLEDRVANMSDEDFQIFYRTILKRLGINRHSDPAFQIKAILSFDRNILLELLNQFEARKFTDAS